MKIAEAKAIINGAKPAPKPGSFRVHFERIEGMFLCSDYFPDNDEPAFEFEVMAWQYAAAFAGATRGSCVNIYVINAKDYTPVPGYEKKMIVNR